MFYLCNLGSNPAKSFLCWPLVSRRVLVLFNFHTLHVGDVRSDVGQAATTKHARDSRDGEQDSNDSMLSTWKMGANAN